MIQGDLKHLRDFVIRYNPLFQRGYETAYQDEQTGIIHSDRMEIFPNDTLGNYFYFRLPKNYGFVEGSFFANDDCARGLGMATPIIMVACVRNADADKLLFNLINTISLFDTASVKINSAIGNSIAVIQQELSKIKKENLDAAKQRLDMDYTIVSITFTYTKSFEFTELHCLQNPLVC